MWPRRTLSFILFFFNNCKSNKKVLSWPSRNIHGYTTKHKCPMDSRIQFMLYCMGRIFFSSHLWVTSFRVLRVISQDDWWMVNLTSWERLFWTHWFLRYLTQSNLMVGIEGEMRLSTYMYTLKCLLLISVLQFLIFYIFMHLIYL